MMRTCLWIASIAIVAAASPDENIAWLEENAKSEGVITLPSGLQYKILASGPPTGQRPNASDPCTCHYEGATPAAPRLCLRRGLGPTGECPSQIHHFTRVPRLASVTDRSACPLADCTPLSCSGSLIDGSVFDSSRKRGSTATFSPDGVIKGWTEALQMMRPGDRWMLYIPASLGYGHRGAGGSIPPGATLIFDLELISFEENASLFTSLGLPFLDNKLVGPIKLWMALLGVVSIWHMAVRAGGRDMIRGRSVTASHILVADEGICAHLWEEVTSGKADFAALAKEHSTCPSGKSGGSLGTLMRGQVMPQTSAHGRTLQFYAHAHRVFDKVCWSAPVGEVQGPVQTQFGYHLIVVTERTGPEDKKNK